MADILLSNTLSGEKEPLKTMKPNQAGLYVCGITPYDEAHLGHGRCYVVFDLLKRVLERNGYAVRHIQNFTDVDDKIIERANKLGKDPTTFAEPFIESFHKWMKALNVLPATEYPKVTTHMKEIKDLIQSLINKGFAYELEGDVYYAVKKFPDYEKLSKRKLEDLMSGARVSVDERKRDPLDFALWKKAKTGEPSWDSPWGKGRPGWHIECSAMSIKYLGEEFDIHGGGLDLVFPHHTNEIAQSEGATGKKFAHVWVHNGFVTINQEKMSKSLGNFFTLKDILSAYDPMVVRYFLLTQHYRSPLNFSDQDLKATQSVWKERISVAARMPAGTEKPAEEVQKLLEEFDQSLRNDLNTAQALGALNKVVSLVFKKVPGAGGVLKTMLNVLGLSVSDDKIENPEALQLLQARENARKAKDWATADKVRDQLKALGFTIEDTSQGPRLKKI